MDILPVPNQPKTFKFQQRSFGQKNPVKRRFQSSWFANRTWLHYVEANDLAYCHVCMAAYSDGNETLIRNISSNIPTKLTEFINRNCTQDAIKTPLQPF